MTPEEVSESIAQKFTRVMNATPSPLAPLCDLLGASTLSGALLMAGFFVIRHTQNTAALYVVLLVSASPLLMSLALSAFLRTTRARVVAWLVTLPFPVDNMNAILDGLGDTVEVEFAPDVELPDRASLQPQLDAVSEDVLLVKERPEERSLEIRLGIIDSKRFPLRTSHRRWERMVLLVTRVLIPLSQEKKIARMRIV
jgi:hypothetical protein